jgi:predicted Zn-dependent protease
MREISSWVRGGFEAWLGIALVAAATTSCALNPATGKQQLNLYSEAEEIEMGRQADREISSQLGLYADEATQSYVAGIGQRLAAQSERPGLPWSFKVVDDPAVNAFALPGGFVYVTRGILGHMTSEAELASVLGHEIGHVTAQHSVNQLSKQQFAVGGLILGAILAPEVAQAGDLAQAGLGLLFLRFGRDDERQADDLGLRYLTDTGYEAREMPEMFRVLESVSAIEGGGRLPSWLATHPDPGARRERTLELIAQRRYKPGDVGAERLLERLAGMPFGTDPTEGYFEGSTYYHPGLALKVEFPATWRAINEKARVMALDPERVAQLELTLVPGTSAQEATREFFARQGLQSIGSRRTRLSGLTAVQSDFSVATQRALSGRVVFVEKGGKVLRLLGLVFSDRAIAARGAFDGFFGSFATLRDRSRLEVQPQRIRLVRLDRSMSFEEFARRWPSDVDPRVLAAINRIGDPSLPLAAGTTLKRIEGKRTGSQTAGPAPQ